MTICSGDGSGGSGGGVGPDIYTVEPQLNPGLQTNYEIKVSCPYGVAEVRAAQGREPNLQDPVLVVADNAYDEVGNFNALANKGEVHIKVTTADPKDGFLFSVQEI